MTRTYADITVGSIMDGEVIQGRKVVAGGDKLRLELLGHLGGKRTENWDRDISDLNVWHIADVTLVNVTDDDLTVGAYAFCDHLDRVSRPAWAMRALHGVALEMHRRRALTHLGCVCHGKG